MKYVGSKNRLSRYIVPIIQKCIDENNINTYIEPFVGGANIIDKIRCKNKIGYDSNKYLIEFWKAIQNGWIPFDEIEMSKNFYDDVKNNVDIYSPHIVGLVGLCATYNAKWFGGYAGVVTTKLGTKRDYYDEAVRNVLKQKENILDIDFQCNKFNDLSNIKNAVIYCDPPYANTTKYKDDFNHDEYWSKIRELSFDNYIICSEYQAPDDFYCIWSKELITTLDKNSRSTSVEKLFVYSQGKYAELYCNNMKGKR